MATANDNVIESTLSDAIDLVNKTNGTNADAKNVFVARTDGMLLSYSFLLLAALMCVYFGAYRSVSRKDKQKISGEKPDVLTTKDGNVLSIYRMFVIVSMNFLAAMFPFIASGFLFGIYLVILLVSKEYITFVLNIYFFLIGIIALYRALQPVLARIRLPLLDKLRERQFHITLAENNPSTPGNNSCLHLDMKFDFVDILTLFISVLIGVWYLLKRHWIANNIFGIAFSINAIEILHFNK
jgi:minor histocompatibility antigen H13